MAKLGAQARHVAGLISFGKGGHGIQYQPFDGGSSSLSGYDGPELFLWEVNRGKYAGDVLADGCPVLDVRARVELPGGVAVALGAPLPDLLITDDAEIGRLDTRGSVVAAALMTQPGNGYGALLRQHEAVRAVVPDEPGPLDRVSIGRYLAYWRKHGARVGTLGTVDGGARVIRWEDGATTEGSNPYRSDRHMGKIRVFAMFTEMRSWDSVGEVFATEDERTASLLAFVEELRPDQSFVGFDDAALIEIATDHGHDVHLFDGEITMVQS